VFDCRLWPTVSRGGAWLERLPVRPPPELDWDDADASAPLSVVDACARLGFCARRALELSPSGPPADDHWTPILAIGSNAGVSQLARKFPHQSESDDPPLFPDGVVVPVVRSVITGFDVGYAPLVTSYGSAPATLHPSPGTRCELFVTHLTPRQAQRMHATEGAYHLQRLSNVELREGAGLEHLSEEEEGGEEGKRAAGVAATTALTYGHQAGTLHVVFSRRRGGKDESGPLSSPTPVALAEIRAQGRVFPALRQTEMLRALRHALHLDETAGAGGGGGGGDSSGARGQQQQDEQEEDRLPPPRPLPPVPHPDEHNPQDDDGEEHWLGLDEAELDAFLLACLDCDATRKRRVERLTAAARPVTLDPPLTLEILETMGTVLSDNVK
jgi:hypothetical protein